MLIHTSGRRAEHDEDVEQIQKTLATLSKHDERGFENMRKKFWSIADEYGDADEIGIFVLQNIRRNVIAKINSSGSKSGKVSDIANPTSLFSFGVGGNIMGTD